MCHLIRLCIVLLLFSLSQVIFAFSETRCFELDEYSECACFYNENLIDISCPIMSIHINTDVEINKDYKQIECKLTNFEYIENYKMDIGNCDYVEINSSHLSGEPITDLLNHLGIKNVKHLIFYGNELGVNFHLLTGLSDLEKLFFTYTKFTQPPTDLTNVTTRNAYERLVELPQYIFVRLKKLTELDLSFDGLEQLPDGIFRNQHKLKELNLYGNQLRNLNKKVFEGATSLQKLNLSSNSIERFEPDVFSFLENLSEIDLRNNKLNELSSEFFVNNTNVTILHKDGKIELSQNIFDRLEKLIKIDLSFNDLKQLPDGIFCNQHKLKELILSGNRLRNLNKIVFQGVTSLEKLDLSANSIDHFDPDVFSLLPILSELNISGNELHEVSSQLFAYNKNLAILHIDDEIELSHDIIDCLKIVNNLDLSMENTEELPEGIFRNKHKLKELYLSGNRLRNLNKTFFEGATSLQKLNLNLNSIDHFDSDIFTLLPNLREIALTGHDFRQLSSQLFAKNKNLTILRIYTKSEIKWLPSALLANLPHLQKVHIRCNYLSQTKNFYDSLLSISYKELQNRSSLLYVSCAISEIPEDLFTNSSKWTDISLADNKLRSLPVNLFADQNNLYTLDLSHNELESLQYGLFRDTNSLRLLDLTYNQLTELSDTLLLSLGKLEQLYLDNNKLQLLPAELFRNTKNLILLRLSYNQLTELSSIIFTPLVKLEKLDLSYNRLSSLPDELFRETSNLFKLKLSYNQLTEISPKIFTPLFKSDLSFNNTATLNYRGLQFDTNRIFVDISHNQVRTINVTGFELPENLMSKTYYNNIDLNYNPLDCDCKLVSFLRYIRAISHFKINFIINNLLCDKPYDKRLRPVSELMPEELLCPIGQPHCPLGCKCWKRTYDATVIIVNCSNSNLTEVLALSLVQTIVCEEIELYVENRNLRNLPTMSLPGYAVVTKMYAAGNKISQIDVNNLPTKLKYLDLSRNNLKRLDDDVIELFIQSLTQLALAGNPWNCDCASRSLMIFVHRRSDLITDHKRIFCASPRDLSVVDYFIDNNLCQEDHHVLITLIVCFSVFSLFIVVAVAFYYKNQTEIKIWMYRYPWLRRLVSEDEVDKNRSYDAFISYAHEDQEFVGRTLVPELEQNGPIRYKLCVHVRDFAVGESILKQIVGAIDESKRTIFVLSNHFIQSAWACMEFRLAHKAALNEGRARIIVIVYGDIGDIELLDPLLRAYLKMNTYLEWGDPWFWDRLRYAMPHSVNAPPVESYQAITAV